MEDRRVSHGLDTGSLKGIEDARGQLFFDYIRILKEFKPKFSWRKM